MAYINNTDIATSIEIVVIKSVYLFLCILLGIIGNSLVIIAIYKYKTLQTVTNYFVLNLAVTDLLFAVFGIPTIMITTIAKKWLLGYFMCDLVGFLNSLFCTTSIWTLVMISVNRFLNVAKANYIRTLYTKKRANLVIFSVWIFSALISFPPLVGWSRFKSGTNSCTVDVKFSKGYAYFVGVINYLFPMVFLASLYLRIFIILHHYEKTKLKNKIKNTTLNNIECHEDLENISSFEYASASTVLHQTENEGLTDKKVTKDFSKYKTRETVTVDRQTAFVQNAAIQIKVKKKKKLKKSLIAIHIKQVRVTKMLMVLIFGFFFCWTPFFFGAMYRVYKSQNSGFSVTTFGIMFACLNCILNPFLYSIMNLKFRKCVVQMRNR